MTSQEIIEKIRINTIELSDILKKLEDRPTLVSIGVTESDEDEDAVEDAIFEIKNSIQEYNDEATENGTVEYFGKQYALQSNPELTNGQFTGRGTGANVSYGEQYMSEWSCPAIGTDGMPYRVIWCWPEVKGKETNDMGSYDWSSVDEILTTIDVTLGAVRKPRWLAASASEGKTIADWIFDIVDLHIDHQLEQH
jgi:hypothetical protein